MPDVIKMDYSLMEEMSQAFLKGVEQLENTMQEMQSVANTLEEGALLGRGGSAFTDAIRNTLCPAMARLNDKFKELSNDVLNAMKDMQEADKTSQGLFG